MSSSSSKRTKVAAATASVIPFNCIICFDEFNLKNRVPVVLPCGHTFVCEMCSKRLKRCMECRVPLYYTIPKKTQPAMVAYNRGGGYCPTPLTPPQLTSTIPTHPQQKQQMPLPIPKNLVLIAMMEAAQLQSTPVIKEDTEQEEREECSDSRKEEEEDEEELDLNNVISGLNMLTGPCGTYAAKRSLNLDATTATTTPFHSADEETTEPEPALHVSASSDTCEVRQPCSIEKGSTLQVVGFKDGVAQLARGYGEVSVDASSLVKVSGPLDKSCKLEGMLHTIAEKSEDLRTELAKNERIETLLREEIEKESPREPNHPIIASPPIEDDSPRKDLENKQVDAEPTTPTDVRTINQVSAPILKPEAAHDNIPLSLRLQSNILDLDDSELPDFSYHYGVGDPMAFPFCVSPNRGLGSTSLPTYRRTGSSESLNELGYGCTAFLGAGAHLFTEGEVPRRENLLEGPHESRTRSNSADGEHQHLQPSFTASFDTVDFRTGLSGHRGLQNTHTTHSPVPRVRAPMSTRYMMSVHDGIGFHPVTKKHSPKENCL